MISNTSTPESSQSETEQDLQLVSHAGEKEIPAHGSSSFYVMMRE